MLHTHSRSPSNIRTLMNIPSQGCTSRFEVNQQKIELASALEKLTKDIIEQLDGIMNSDLRI